MELYWGSLTKYPIPSDMTDEMVLDLLGKWRGENYLRQKTELGRALSFCAGMTLKEAFVKNKFNLIGFEPRIGENGKPSGEEMEFNLSHSGEVALVAFSSDFLPVGCDVQRIENKPEDRIMAISKRFFSVNEVAKMQDLIHEENEKFRRLFYLVFSAKEAYIKMTGEGLKRAMDSFDIPLDDEIISELSNERKIGIKRETQIDGELVEFSFYLPCCIHELVGQIRENDEYVAVVCKKKTKNRKIVTN